jgi:malonyl-CoA O-methyltransferase
MEVEQEAVLAMLPAVSGRVALDAGCGTGRYAHRLRGLGASLVIGCDRSAAMLARAGGPHLIRADLPSLPLASAAVDVVVCGLALNDVADLRPVMTELARILKPGGSLVASLLHPRGAAEGWRRTFDAGEGVREVPACWHAADQLQRACAQASLSIVEVREPGLTPPGPPVALIFRAVLEETASKPPRVPDR